MQEGLLHDGELKDCELFTKDCTVTQCFKWQQYGHTAKICNGRRSCTFCAKEHDYRSPTQQTPSSHSCSNCKGKHTTWTKLCPVQAAQASKASAAYAARPSLYKIPANFTPDLPCPPTSPPCPFQSQAFQTQLTPSCQETYCEIAGAEVPNHKLWFI